MFWRRSERDMNPLVPSLVLPPSQFTKTTNVRSLKRFDLFVNSNGIGNNKCEVLLSYLDDETLNILENSKRDDNLSYAECSERLLELFEDRGEPKPVSRERFYRRTQEKDEKIIQFASALSELGKKAYSDLPSESIDIIHKDQFIYGLCNPNLQDRVLSQQPASFDEAIDMAKIFESSDQIHNRAHALRSENSTKPTMVPETNASSNSSQNDYIKQQEIRIARLEELLKNSGRKYNSFHQSSPGYNYDNQSFHLQPPRTPPFNKYQPPPQICK